MKIAIVGAGVSGLAAGRFLAERGHAVELFEAADHPNTGLLESREVEGYTYDVGGGHIVYSRDPRAAAFFEALYPDGALLRHHRCTRILFHDRFVPYPFENGLSHLPPDVNFECLSGYIRAYVERGDRPAPANFRDWIYYRMGAGMAKHFMVPYNEKIWDGDLSEMGVEWVEGRVPEAPIEDILRSALGIPTEGYTHQLHFQYPSRGGIHDLARRLARPLEGRIRYGHGVEHIRRKGDHRFEVDGAEYDAVVYTAPLDRAPALVEGLDRGAAKAAAALRHISLTTFLFGMEAAARPFSWVYLPYPEQGPVNRVTYLSNYSPNNAPEGKASLLAEVTHRRPWAVGRADVEAVRRHLARAGLLREDAVEVVDFGTVEYAYILYERGFSRVQERALAGLEDLGIHPLGRFGRYRYLNMDHCILEARELAEDLDEKDG